jgi:dTMP kinase
MRGRLITFEGGEGTGKSTQTELLADRLKSLGNAVVHTREPGGSPGAEAIRHVLLSGAAKPLGPETEEILFAAARDDHVRTTIEPALLRGAWVISDRFIDSTRVYQGSLGQVDIKFIRALERATIGDLVPDLTVVLDVPVEVGLARAHARRGDSVTDRFESESPAFHAELREAYRRIVLDEPQRCVLIDATLPKAEVAEHIWQAVNERLHPASATIALESAAS